MRGWRRFAGVAAAMSLAGGLGVVLAPPAAAAIIMVNTLGDAPGACPGTCTLRAAILAANLAPGDDEIQFSVNGTIVLADAAELVVNAIDNSALTIRGNGVGNTIIDAADASRVINVTGSDPITLSNLTIQNGITPPAGNGAGVNNGGSSVTTTNVNFTSNDAVASGGAISAFGVTITGGTFHDNSGFAAGAISIANGTISDATFTANSSTSNRGGAVIWNGSLTVTDSTFGGPNLADGNTATVAGGALATISGVTTLSVTGSTFQNNDGGTEAGAIYVSSGSTTMTITTSTFETNEGNTSGGAIVLDDESAGPGRTLTISQSTFNGNKLTSPGNGAAIRTEGLVSPTSTTITNNTFDANDGTTSGGAISSDGSSTLLSHNTFHGNDATTGSAVAVVSGGTVAAANIFDANSNTACTGTVTDGGYNLTFGDTVGSTCPVTGTSFVGDPDLGALQLNPPGTTKTRAPDPTSPAVDAIPEGQCPPPTTDQRGITRPQGATSECDIGAYELDQLGTFVPLPPVRILDTRPAPLNVGGGGVLTPQETRDVDVMPAGGIPNEGVSAILVNVTATGPTKAGWLTLFPADADLPTAANLNFVAGQTVPNLVVVKVGTVGGDAGKISINNTGGCACAGNVHVIMDVAGYYLDSSQPPAAGFTGVTPTRILDTRPAPLHVGPLNMFGPQAVQELPVGGVGGSGVPADADAVVMNVTATSPTANGWLTIYPGDGGPVPPTAANLNFVAGQTVPNLVTVKLGDGAAADAVKIANTFGCSCAGSVHVIVDVVGYYEQAVGDGLITIVPTRIRDTRAAPLTVGGPAGAVAPQGDLLVDPNVAPGLPPVGQYSAIVVNVTATGASQAGWLTVYPSDESLPTAANLNFLAGQTVPNLVKIAVGADGKIKINNTGGCACAGTTHVIVDLIGYFR
jgi:CSLREA domain-containing protein